MGRILSLDLGEKRTGVAVSDRLKLIARPLLTLTTSSPGALVESVRTLVKKEEAELVLIGYPLLQEEQAGPLARLAGMVRQGLEEAAVPCALVDESFSSREAEEALHARLKHRRSYRAQLDQLAAAVILQHYLDSLPRPANAD